MYFVPMFDDTDGYYASASGVSLPTSSPSSALVLKIDINLVVVLLGRPSRRAFQLGSGVACCGRW